MQAAKFADEIPRCQVQTDCQTTQHSKVYSTRKDGVCGTRCVHGVWLWPRLDCFRFEVLCCSSYVLQGQSTISKFLSCLQALQSHAICEVFLQTKLTFGGI